MLNSITKWKFPNVVVDRKISNVQDDALAINALVAWEKGVRRKVYNNLNVIFWAAILCPPEIIFPKTQKEQNI